MYSELVTFIGHLSLIASLFWLFQAVFAFIHYLDDRAGGPTLDVVPSLTVVVPSYNESAPSVRKTIESLKKQRKVNLEIFLIDDGSTEPVCLDDPAVTLIRFEANRGKREAQMAGVERSSYEWIVTVDSDTELVPDALYNLYCEAIRKNAAAITGTILLGNEKQCLLTKMTACMYWFSFYQERASQSYFGSLLCCAGALSMYRKDIMLNNKEEYLNQTFMNNKCFAGDDRHMTNLFLLDEKRVCWTPKAIAYTESPSTYSKFLKQQLRWTRSHFPAFWFLIKNWRRWRLLPALFIIKLLFRYVYMMLIYVLMFYAVIQSGSVFPLVIIFLSILIITFVKALIAYIYTLDAKFVSMLFYSVWTFFVFNPIMFYALFTPSKTGWMTRKTQG